ncbi:hypothetical protein ACAG25_17535 [Mycobacterium sp. pV006]|uniref:hypothetical protein n=1 Tax=Mycobacterium sp. pV006 TaxID=3238983 RepID=UPI00351AC0AC
MATAAFAAAGIAVAATVAPLPEPSRIQPSAHLCVQTSAASTINVADLQLTASVQRLLLDPTPTLASTPSLIAFADAVDAAYEAIEKWVRYGFQVASDIIVWIPYIGILGNQIMVVYSFVESLINSGVFNTTDWLRGEGSVLKNVADWVVDLGLATVWLGIDEVGAWIPLPPVDIYPPRPPAADLPEGFLGDAVVGASHLLADVSNAVWNVWEPIRGGIDWTVNAASDVLDTVGWIPFVPLINFELVATWELIAGEIDALTGFAHDMINAGDQFVTDAIQGDGLIAAVVNAFNTTIGSIAARTGQAWQALVDWMGAQADFFLSPFDAAGAEADDSEMSDAPTDPPRVQRALTADASVSTPPAAEEASTLHEGVALDDVEAVETQTYLPGNSVAPRQPTEREDDLRAQIGVDRDTETSGEDAETSGEDAETVSDDLSEEPSTGADGAPEEYADDVGYDEDPGDHPAAEEPRSEASVRAETVRDAAA